MQKQYLALALGLLTVVGTLTMWGTWAGGPSVSQARENISENLRSSASESGTIRYVAPTGEDTGDCTDPAHPCATVQYAVDQAAPGDEVRIATGVYTDVHQRAGITQTVYISKTVTLRGGYDTVFTDPPDPDAHPTTLDAQGQGRVLYICTVGESITPTIEGLRITGGNAAGLGGGPWGPSDAGGGVYNLNAVTNLCDNQIFSNTVDNGYGGGMYLAGSAATLNGNTIATNTARFGGGLFLLSIGATLNGNTITANTASDKGGGLSLQFSDATLVGNTVTTNTAGYGGGMHLAVNWSATVLKSNTVAGNRAKYDGGGLNLFDSAARLSGNTISSNTAYSGGGLFLYESPVVLKGNTISANTAILGGGLHLSNSDASLIGNTIVTNTAGYGGGLYLTFSAATLNSNIVTANTAHGNGGGLYLYYYGAPTLNGNAIISNTADAGGGMYLTHSDAILTGNTVAANTANQGGGLYLDESAAVLRENDVTTNTANHGGGLYLNNSDIATVSGNTVAANTASQGGGLYLWSDDATLTNNTIADNRASIAGSGLYVLASSPRLNHTTIARNSGGDGSGICVTDLAGHFYETIALTNTILVSHTVGISVTGGNTVTMNGVLWYDTPITVSQAATATVTVQNQHWGDPAFVNPAAGDYHIGPTSAALNAGVDAGVTTDMDGDARPDWCFPDLGADEFITGRGCRYFYLPLVFRS